MGMDTGEVWVQEGVGVGRGGGDGSGEVSGCGVGCGGVCDVCWMACSFGGEDGCVS